MVRRDWWLISLLAGLSLVTHFVGLSSPRQVIFDEVHFGKFVTAYCCTHERFFDIHPPHAKLFIAGTAWLGGYRGGYPFEHIGEVYGPGPVAALRFFPALTGFLLPLVIFALLRQLGGSSAIAFLGGWLVLFDNALTLQTRIIALDGLLLLATFGALSLFLLGRRLVEQGASSYYQWFSFGLAGACAGLAIGTKFTGLTALVLLGFLTLVELKRAWQGPHFAYQKSRLIAVWIGRGLVMLVAAVVVYLGGWVLHFALLDQPGGGDAFHRPDFSGAPWPVSFIREVSELHVIMFDVNYNLTAEHPYASRWWTWPFMKRPIFYWQGEQAFIYFLGNPVVWWGVTALFVAAVIAMIIRYGRSDSRHGTSEHFQYRRAIWLPLVGFGVAMLPMVRIPRALFLYHYLTPLLMSLLVGLLWLDWWVQRRYGRVLFAGGIPYALVLAAVVFTFLFFSPLTYGWVVSPEAQPWLFWFTSWR